MAGAGTRKNVIADRCVFCLDLRTVPGGPTTGELVAEVERRTQARVTIDTDLPAFETPPDAALVAAAQRARPASPLSASPTMSDAVYVRQVPTLKVGPGRTERSHTADEYVTTAELAGGVAFYAALVRAFFAGARP